MCVYVYLRTKVENDIQVYIAIGDHQLIIRVHKVYVGYWQSTGTNLVLIFGGEDDDDDDDILDDITSNSVWTRSRNFDTLSKTARYICLLDSV